MSVVLCVEAHRKQNARTLLLICEVVHMILFLSTLLYIYIDQFAGGRTWGGMSDFLAGEDACFSQGKQHTAALHLRPSVSKGENDPSGKSGF
ncbi:hypothetical protein EI42_00983 [Thermosporothrix hazakensis]|uniref:Uncharacterized protein n=1 Tax=Thermosporothrix hazakensis TaxID=644383 RepID=A0A326UE83_THEHA|nr:hypothetical protein EI42_00983 [Thermosporothrix hazakensis]